MMNKEQIFRHYSEILDDLLDSSLWFETYFQNPYMLDENIFGGDWTRLDDNFSFCTGATRACIVDSDYDYVVKFDIEDDAYGSACKREESIYQHAVERGVDKYLAETSYIGTYTRTIQFYDAYDIEQTFTWYGYGEEDWDEKFAQHEDEMGDIHPIVISIPLYAYRRADPYQPFITNEDEHNYNSSVRRVASPLRSRNLAVAISFVKEFGFDEYVKFSQFGMEEDINDLHFNNIGCIDGHLALIDYSGYHDWESDYDEEHAEWRTGTDDDEE